MPLDSEAITALRSSVDEDMEAAYDASVLYETAPNPGNKSALCEALQNLKDELQAGIAAVIDTQEALGCGAGPGPLDP